MTSGRVEVVNSRGCSRLFPGFASSISSINSFRFNPLMSQASSAVADSMPVGPFTGLIICVTGLSKDILRIDSNPRRDILLVNDEVQHETTGSCSEQDFSCITGKFRTASISSEPECHPNPTFIFHHDIGPKKLALDYLFKLSLKEVCGRCSIGTSRPYLIGLPSCAAKRSGSMLYVEARMQVMAATERLGGHYSASLHPQCTHLVVQICYGRKFEHALKHGSRNGLLIVTLGWFVDSVRRNVRLSESLYSVKHTGEDGMPLRELNQLVGLSGSEKSCLPLGVFEDEKSLSTIWQHHLQSSRKELRTGGAVLSNDCFYVDSDISTELRKKVVDAVTREGATILEHWFVGCPASHVVCEVPSIQRYIGHANHFVTPLWILKTVKEKSLQRLVHLSSDLARQIAMVLENAQALTGQDAYGESTNLISMSSRKSLSHRKCKETLEERQKLVDMAKSCVRMRRSRRMQSCQMPIHPITPNSLMDSICWSVSEPTSSACIYTESSGPEDASEPRTSLLVDDARGDGRHSEVVSGSFSRPLSESEKREVIFKNHFLTILFPIDRFGELGPSSRTFYSEGGFSCLQVLDYIYNFYQENMSAEEIDMAIHTDSRHADRLRALYASQESVDEGFVAFKRIEFVGSRRSFEALKRISGENNSNVYQLVIRA